MKREAVVISYSKCLEYWDTRTTHSILFPILIFNINPRGFIFIIRTCGGRSAGPIWSYGPWTTLSAPAPCPVVQCSLQSSVPCGSRQILSRGRKIEFIKFVHLELTTWLQLIITTRKVFQQIFYPISIEITIIIMIIKISICRMCLNPFSSQSGFQMINICSTVPQRV